MPRIRKKTSNRASTNDRAKIRHKVRETRRKKAKAAKKNPQWKSRKPKDPGIPNEFPYKDQILAEVAEERRKLVEEKEQKRAEKQKARAIARGEIVEDGSEDSGGRGQVEKEGEPKEQGKDAEDVEEDVRKVPVLINRDLPTLQSVLEKADVVLEVVDARDPLVFRSEHIEQLAKNAEKKVLLVLNKIDTCPREALTAWTRHLRMQLPTLMFRSATAFLPEGPTMQDPLLKKIKDKGKAKVMNDDALGVESILNCLSQWAKEREGEEALNVAVVGVSNVGKSSLINSLLKRVALPIYNLVSSSRGPSTTEVPQEVILEVDSQKIVLIDTPGLSFISNEDADPSTLEEFHASDILLRNKGRIERLKNPNPPVAHIVSRANVEDLMLLYSLPAFAKGDCSAFLSGVARANQLVKKKGELDLNGAARMVLRDWSLGKFMRYTNPPANATAAQSFEVAKPTNFSDSIAQLYANDKAILSFVQARKERRKQGGLVGFACGSMDLRKVAVEEPWDGLEENNDEEGDNDGVEDEDEGEGEGMNLDREEDEESEEEEEESSGPEMEESSQEAEDDVENVDEESETDLPHPSHKQKRKRGPEMSMPVPLPPAKKTMFTAIKTTQLKKKPLKPVKASSAMKRSKSSPTATTIPVHNKTSEKKGKIANVTAKTKPRHLALTGKSKDKSEPEVYDFGKFF